MAKTDCIELDDGKQVTRIPILYEDRSVLAIDKPPGWMLVPFNWQKTRHNLLAAIVSSIAARDFWARCRNLKFLRNVHRLDAETSGILLLASSHGALETYGELFESREMEKRYLAVVRGTPTSDTWVCRQRIGPDPVRYGRMRIDEREGKEAETELRVLARKGGFALIEARPWTGRTHQIRLHLVASGFPIVGDPLYGPDAAGKPERLRGARVDFPMGLRAVELRYQNPFTRKPVRITAPEEAFLRAFGFKELAKTPPPPAGKPDATGSAPLDPGKAPAPSR